MNRVGKLFLHHQIKETLTLYPFIVMFDMLKSLFGMSDNAPLKEALSNGAFLVDVRTPAEFAEGSVKGAINIPLDKIANQLARFSGKTNIVVFCRSGMRSSQAKSILEQNGVQNVINGGGFSQVNSVMNSLQA